MRKLGIVLALVAASTIGYAGSAYADGHEESLCPNLPDHETVDGVVHGEEGESPQGHVVQGVNDTCAHSNQTDMLNAGVVCGVLNAVDQGTDGALAGATGPIREGMEGGNPVADTLKGTAYNTNGVECQGSDAPPPDDTTTTTAPDNDNEDDGDNDSEVLANNATADGGLPRTGGELFAGLGFGLMSLGALARRFIG